MNDVGSVHVRLSELFSQHRAHLRNMIAFRLDRRLQKRVDISDVIQESLLNAFQRSDHLPDAPGAELGWLRLVTEQTIVDVHRRHLRAACRSVNRETCVELENPYGGRTTIFALAAALLAVSGSVGKSLEREELLVALGQAIGQLDPVDREVLAMRHFEDLSNQEVADILGLTKSGACNRYVRAISRLRDLVKALPAFGDSR